MELEAIVIVALIKTLTVAYPAMSSWGFEMEQIIVIVCRRSKKLLARHLQNFENCTLSSNASKKMIGQCMCEMFSEAIVFIDDNTPASRTRIQMISSAVQTGQIEGNDVIAFPVIISDNVLSSEIIRNPFYIEIDELPEHFLLHQELIPGDDKLSLIEEEADRIFANYAGTERLLMLASEFILSRIEKEKREKACKYLTATVKKLVNRNEELNDSTGVVELFAESIQRWITNHDAIVISKTSVISNVTLRHIQEVILYDTDFVYFGSHVFSEIAKMLGHLFSINTLKRLLAEEGTLIADDSATYTSKVIVRLETGKPKRVTTIKIRREVIAPIGERDFLILKEAEKRKEKTDE